MTEWLTDRELDAWVTMLRASVLLLQRLDDELQQAHDLSLSDYEVLARLAAAPDGALRMTDLAARALVSKSRLTHAVDRLEKAGLVARQRCESDRRGFYAVLTDEGRICLEQAAPTHVAGVRRYFLGCGDAGDLASVTDFLARVSAGLESEPERPS